MRVHISQLVPGCVLLRDVNGKSGKPLFRKKTVLTEEFIAFLHAFLLEGVDVYATLADGSKFMPPKREQTAVKEMAGSSKSLTNEADPDNMTVIELYHFAVQQYEQLFRQWQSNAPVNVTQVKQIAQTLFQRLDDFTSIILSLPAFAKKANWPSHRSISLCIMSCYLGKKAGLTQKDCMQIGVAALLCNVGMAKMPSIPAPLKSERNQAQEAQYRKHPVYSYRMIENEKGLHHFSKLAVLQHHERIDGSGFPIGLASAKLHRFSKIIAVCDTFYEIMLANPEISAFKAMEDMQKNEFTRLDPVWMKKMQQIFSHLEVGTIVELSDGKKAEIIFNEPNEPLRPIVRVQDSEEIMALQTNPSVYIDSIVPNHP